MAARLAAQEGHNPRRVRENATGTRPARVAPDALDLLVARVGEDGTAASREGGLLVLVIILITIVVAVYNRLVRLRNRQKNAFAQAAIAIVVADRAVTVDAGKLLRAITEALDGPVPPFLPGRNLA